MFHDVSILLFKRAVIPTPAVILLSVCLARDAMKAKVIIDDVWSAKVRTLRASGLWSLLVDIINS